MTHYESVHKDKIEYQLQARYRSELTALRNIGFHELHYSREVVFPFSAALMFWMYPMLKFYGEVVKIEMPLRYVLFNPLVYNREFDTYAHVFGLGVKFGTLFVDDTVLITCNFKATPVVKPAHKIYCYAPYGKISIANAWKQHQQHIYEIEAKGRETNSCLSLENFEKIMHRDDKAQFLRP